MIKQKFDLPSHMRVTMSNGEKWDVPLIDIAIDRAEYFKHEFDDSVYLSLMEDTLPLFEEDIGEASDWAANNMYWREVKANARIMCSSTVDYEDGWTNGEKEFVSMCKLSVYEDGSVRYQYETKKGV